MADYISKNEVLNLIMHNDKVCHYADERYENIVYATACRISDVVANMPAADVQPARFARWIDLDNRILCSGCGAGYDDYDEVKQNTYIFCPNCGARMDGDVE